MKNDIKTYVVLNTDVYNTNYSKSIVKLAIY